MSSEMRDAVKALEAEYRKRATNRAEDGWVTLVNCANDLRALLARAEAGATNPDNVGGLLPCPFCGSAAELSDGLFDTWCARCASDSCHTMVGSGCTPDAEPLHEFKTAPEATAAWNRRAELCRAAPAGGEPAAYRITDGEGSYEYRDELPDQRSIEWSARYGRKWEPLYTRPQVSAPAGSGEAQWPPRAMRGDDCVVLSEGREILPLMSGCEGCRADEAGTWNRCIDECQKAVAKASGAGPDAFRLARWMEIHFRGNFPTPEFREIHAALLRKLQQGADERLLDALKRADALAVCCTAVDSYSRNELWDIAEAFRAHIRPLIASQGQEGGNE